MKDFQRLKEDLISRMEEGLDPVLTYHSVAHTLDVIAATERLAKAEEVNDRELELLRVAALMHDIGFLRSFDEHEQHGADMAREILPEFGFSPEEIQRVAELILSTRVPQQPQNLLEYIICDADLDYLGRPDFFEVGDRLYKEFLARGIVKNFLDWDALQIRFLSSHQYFTQSAIQSRQELKLAHLEKVKARHAQGMEAQ